MKHTIKSLQKEKTELKSEVNRLSKLAILSQGNARAAHEEVTKLREVIDIVEAENQELKSSVKLNQSLVVSLCGTLEKVSDVMGDSL